MDKEFQKLQKELEKLYSKITIFPGSERHDGLKDIRTGFEKETADVTLEVQKRYMQIEIDYLQSILNHDNASRKQS